MEIRQTLQLLLSYVKVDSQSNKVDTSGILSKKCYEHWLKSRSVMPKNPEEAFRKIITAHCRGDNGMQHFPKQIEESLLKNLRQKRIWPCFEANSNVKIGKRGFKSYGHWERRERTLSVSDIDSTDFLKSLFLKKNNLKDQEKFYINYVYRVIFEGYGDEIQGVASKCDNIYYEIFLEVFNLFQTKQISQNLILGQLMGETESYFKTSEFQVVSRKERNFLKDRMTGKCIADLETLNYIHSNVFVKYIYEKEITKEMLNNLNLFSLESIAMQCKVIYEIFTEGESWNRTLEYTSDGNIIILLNKYGKDSNSRYAFVESQEITDQYY